MSLTVVLNLGLKSMRAAVFDTTGTRHAIAYRPIESRMGEGRVEQDPDDWWRAAVATLEERTEPGGGVGDDRDRLVDGGRPPEPTRGAHIGGLAVVDPRQCTLEEGGPLDRHERQCATAA